MRDFLAARSGDVRQRRSVTMAASDAAAHGSGAIGDARVSVLARTAGAAEPCAACLDAMADHPAAAVQADRRQLVDGAFEAVERIACRTARHGEALVVVVATGIAACHGVPSVS